MPFDPQRPSVIDQTERTIQGEMPDVYTNRFDGISHFSVADNGTIAYVPPKQKHQYRLMWVDRNGEEEYLHESDPRLSELQD